MSRFRRRVPALLALLTSGLLAACPVMCLVTRSTHPTATSGPSLCAACCRTFAEESADASADTARDTAGRDCGASGEHRCQNRLATRADDRERTLVQRAVIVGATNTWLVATARPFAPPAKLLIAGAPAVGYSTLGPPRCCRPLRGHPTDLPLRV